MTKYLVGNVSVMPYDVFCICSSESDAQEMILALTEEELYEAWYQYDQDCADFFMAAISGRMLSIIKSIVLVLGFILMKLYSTKQFIVRLPMVGTI